MKLEGWQPFLKMVVLKCLVLLQSVTPGVALGLGVLSRVIVPGCRASLAGEQWAQDDSGGWPPCSARAVHPGVWHSCIPGTVGYFGFALWETRKSCSEVLSYFFYFSVIPSGFISWSQLPNHWTHQCVWSYGMVPTSVWFKASHSNSGVGR